MTLERKTELKRGKPMERTQWKRKPSKKQPKPRKMSPNEFPDEVKAFVRRRSGNVCELRTKVCEGRAVQFHHRKLRGHGDNRDVNCLHLCVACHDYVHGKRGDGSVSKSYLMGYLVRAHLDPAVVPIRPPDCSSA